MAYRRLIARGEQFFKKKKKSVNNTERIRSEICLRRHLRRFVLITCIQDQGYKLRVRVIPCVGKDKKKNQQKKGWVTW